jgi:CxxC motif-containing protein
MTRKIRCIECPRGCSLSVEMENGKVIMVTGNECPKGEKHALSEIENPVRALTSTVACQGLSLKRLPVRTDRPLPKTALRKAMEEIRQITIRHPVRVGDVIVEDFLNSGTNLIATRDCDR